MSKKRRSRKDTFQIVLDVAQIILNALLVATLYLSIKERQEAEKEQTI